MRVLSEGIQETLTKIFSGVLVGAYSLKDDIIKEKKKEAFRQNLPRFLNRFPYNIFEQEYAVFWGILNKTNGIFTPSQLGSILDNNTDIILKSNLVDLSEYNRFGETQLTDEEKFEAFKYRVTESFRKLSNIYTDETEFRSSVNIYIDWYINTLALETAQNMTLIMSDDGLYVKKPGGRRKLYKGYEDYIRYFSEQEAIMRALRENKGTRDVIIDSEWLKKDLEEIDAPDAEGILDTGIEIIDKTVTSFRRGHMIDIVGQTKGGKTRFANHLVARALASGLNVAVWPLEGRMKEWTAYQASHIVFEEYAADAFKAGQKLDKDSKGIIVIDTDRMLNNQFNSREEREAAIEAKTKLATDFSRGKLSFIQGTCYVEDFLDILNSHYENCNQFDVIVIDSPLLIQSKTGIPERERIATAFISLKAWITSGVRNPIAITTAQLKQEVIDELRRNKDKEMDVTAAGGSSEAVRTPDEVIGIFSSKESRDLGQVTIESIASRHHDNFDKFICACALGSCYFVYRPELAEFSG